MCVMCVCVSECICTWMQLKKKVGGGEVYNNRFYTLRTLLFAGTKLSEISDLPKLISLKIVPANFYFSTFSNKLILKKLAKMSTR